MTTRPHLRDDFKTFGKVLVNLQLTPFTDADQYNYLLKFLSSEKRISQKVLDKDLENFVKKSLKKFYSSFNDNYFDDANQEINMMAIPFNIYMFAIVFQDEIIKNKFDLDAVLSDRNNFNFLRIKLPFFPFNYP